MDNLSIRSRKYYSSPSKHRLNREFYLNYSFILVYMILFKRNIFVNQSYISFYESNNHIKLWMTDMKSFDHIRQKHTGSIYSKKQDQSAKRSYYSMLKILSTITSFSLPINMTSRIEEKKNMYKKQELWIKKQGKRKALVEKYNKLKRVHPLWYTKYLWESQEWLSNKTIFGCF